LEPKTSENDFRDLSRFTDHPVIIDDYQVETFNASDA
jgi:hypothetical protein